MPRSPRTYLLLAAASGLALGCSEPGTDASYDPTIPTDWVSVIDNPYLPLIPGTIYVFTSQTADGQETDTVEVLAGSVAVNGVAATDVLDLVYVDGALTEETHDWYAQDGAGNVWYLGEDTKEYENGQVVSTAGSWTWGVDGALPGVLMWADPAAYLDTAYRQEYLKGVAEDWGKVTVLDVAASVPAGDYTGCITTEEWDGSKPSDPREHKTYCPGVGAVRAVEVGAEDMPEELISVTTP